MTLFSISIALVRSVLLC